MQGRDTIDRVAADACKMRHAHMALAGFVDEGHALDALFIAEKANAHLLEEMRVDFINDLQDSRQHAAEYLDGPALQCLRQQRVIGVGKSPARHVPCLPPGHQ